jgi:hypothetical protein
MTAEDYYNRGGTHSLGWSTCLSCGRTNQNGHICAGIISETLPITTPKPKHVHRYTVAVEWQNTNLSSRSLRVKNIVATKIMCEICMDIKEVKQ